MGRPVSNSKIHQCPPIFLNFSPVRGWALRRWWPPCRSQLLPRPPPAWTSWRASGSPWADPCPASSWTAPSRPRGPWPGNLGEVPIQYPLDPSLCRQFWAKIWRLSTGWPVTSSPIFCLLQSIWGVPPGLWSATAASYCSSRPGAPQIDSNRI